MKKTNKNGYFILVLVIFATISCADLAIAQSVTSGALIDATTGTRLSLLTQVRVLFSTTGGGYVDNAGGNVDFKLEVCGAGLSGYGAAIAYLIAPNSASLQQSFLIALLPNGSSFAPLSAGPILGCFETTASYNINSGLARYPAKAFAVVDINGDGTVDPNDLIINMSSNGFFGGSFNARSTTATLQANYVQATGFVNSIGPGSSAQVDICTASGLPSNCGTWGSSSTSQIDASLVMGICVDDAGLVCNDTVKRTLGAANSNLNTSIVNPLDSQIFNPYFVTNGIGYQFCIGPDVNVVSVNANPSVGPKGTIVNLTAPVVNVNNVDVTTSFTVEFWVSGSNVCNGSIINSGANRLQAFSANTKTATCIWDTSSVTPGTSTIIGTPKDAIVGIKDCNDGNDNGTGYFTTETVWMPRVWIDSVETNVFPDAGRPYNLTVFINNSDGGNPPVLLRLVEENGMSVFAPTQLYTLNIGDSGVISKATSQVITDDTGFISFAVVPTGTKLYNPEYAYLNVSSYVGNHSIYFEIFNNATGAELQLFFNGSKQDDFPFVLTNLSPRTPNATEKRTLVVINQNSLVKEALDLTYRSLATAVRWLK